MPLPEIILIILQVGTMLWVIRLVGAGLGEHDGKSNIQLSAINLMITCIVIAFWVGIDRVYALHEITPVTWRIIPVFLVGFFLLGTQVFHADSRTSRWLTMFPRFLGLMTVITGIAIFVLANR